MMAFLILLAIIAESVITFGFIAYVITHEPHARRAKKKPRMIPIVDDERISRLIADDKLTDAATLYADVANVDEFTARDAIQKMLEK